MALGQNPQMAPQQMQAQQMAGPQAAPSGPAEMAGQGPDPGQIVSQVGEMLVQQVGPQAAAEMLMVAGQEIMKLAQQGQ